MRIVYGSHLDSPGRLCASENGFFQQMLKISKSAFSNLAIGNAVSLTIMAIVDKINSKYYCT